MGQDQARKLSAFGLAAVALDREIECFEMHTERALRRPLDSRKSLEQAAADSAEAMASRQRLGEHMGALVAALQEMRARNESLTERLDERMREVDARMSEARELTERANQLGTLAKELAAGTQRLTEAARAGKAPPEVTAELATIVERLDGILQVGRTLSLEAKERKLPELSEEIEALRSSLQSARNRAHLACEKLRSGEPS